MTNEFGRASDRDYPYRVKVAKVINWQDDTMLKEAEEAYWKNTDIPDFADPAQDQFAARRKVETMEKKLRKERRKRMPQKT